MLDVLCSKTVRKPDYQVLTCRVQLPNYHKLTPRSARAALEVAGYYTGSVQYTSVDKSGENRYYKAYRVYLNSVRKLWDDVS